MTSTAAKLLRRRLSATAPLLSPLCSNPNPLFPTNPLSHLRRLPSSLNHHPFSNNTSYRSLSWQSWTRSPEPITVIDGGGVVETSETEAEPGPVDSGSVTLPEFDGTGMMDAAAGEGFWYRPLIDPVITLLDGYHDLTSLPWWIIIVTSTMAFRTALLPLLILQLKKISFRGSVLNMPGVLGILAKYYKLYLDLLAVPLLLIGFQIPQGSLVYWATNSLLSSVQILSLRNPYVRKKLGLPDDKMVAKSRTTAKSGSLENTMEHNDSILTRNITSKAKSGSLENTMEHNDSILTRNITSKGNAEDRTKESSIENNLHESSSSPEHKISAESLSPEELLNLALEYSTSGHLDEALPLLRLATEKEPGLIRALIAMGQIYCSKGSLEESAEYFELAVSKIQEEIEEEELGLLVLALYGAGFSRINQGRIPEGIEHLKRIGELKEPESPVNKACYYRGLVLLASQLFNDGEKYEAAKYLRRAAAYDPAVNAMVKECEA